MTTQSIAAEGNQFANEETNSRFGYLSGYQPKPIAEQIARLRELFPQLGTADVELANGPLPEGAEGWFAIPRWEKIAYPYIDAAEKVLAMIASQRKFCNYREGSTGPNYLRQYIHSMCMWKKLGDQQTGHDVLIVPAQFGLRHRGKSVRRVRVVIERAEHEFGLGAFAVGIMLLTHPERLKDYDDLSIDCAGDECDDPEDSIRFSEAPYFGFSGDKIVFRFSSVNDFSGSKGSASGFVTE